jgi:hypothetical protein
MTYFVMAMASDDTETSLGSLGTLKEAMVQAQQSASDPTLRDHTGNPYVRFWVLAR